MNSLAFSPDGPTLATGNGDNAVQLWNVSYLTDLPSSICASAGTSFNRSEWAYNVPGLAYQTSAPNKSHRWVTRKVEREGPALLALPHSHLSSILLLECG